MTKKTSLAKKLSSPYEEQGNLHHRSALAVAEMIAEMIVVMVEKPVIVGKS